jgi:hypothetical protein
LPFDDREYTPGVYTVDVDRSKCYIANDASGTSNMALHITSTQSIGVYAINMQQNSTDATTILPVTTWGTDYTVIGNYGLGTYYTNITVIAPAGAVISIRDKWGTPVVTNQPVNASEPVYNYLKKKDQYGYLTEDLTGYTVESDRNVAVFSSIKCGDQISAGACDHNYEQLYPSGTAGKNFFLWNVSPGYKNIDTQDRVIIKPLKDSTTVTVTKGGTTYSNFIEVRAGSHQFQLDTAVYTDGSTAPAWITSDKPVIVNHLLGFAPSIHWWAPVEQRVTRAVVAPFPAAGNSVIDRHRLDVMIPDGARQAMTVKEKRGSTVTYPTLTFYTNASNPDYAIATREYADSDADVVIELSNPAGFIAHMSGFGDAESYIYSAGSSAFDLQNYFTVRTKTQPYNDTYYSATEEATHTFVPADNIIVMRCLERAFDRVSWMIHGAAYPGVPENTNVTDTLTFPASIFHCGKDSITMSVRYTGATADSVYTGYVWISPATASDIDVSGSLTVCSGQSATLTASSTTVASPVFKWYRSQIYATPFHEGPSYTTPALTATTTYYVSVSNAEVCENSPGKRKEVTVTVPEITVNPVDNREYHLQDTVPAIHVSCSPALSGVTYKWTTSNTHIGLPEEGEGDIPAFEAKGIGRATITVTPYYNNCPGTPTEFVITVYYMVPVNPHLRSNVIGN